MQTTLYSATVPVMKKSLTALSAILDKAAQFSKESGMSEEELLGKRLFEDMFPFSRQIQLVSDQAKSFSYRLRGENPPSMADTETTIEELKQRIAKTIELLDKETPESINGREDAMVHISYFPGKYIHGFDYVFEYVMPNFFFHVTTAYDILRASGVVIGKADYLGGLSFHDDPATQS